MNVSDYGGLFSGILIIVLFFHYIHYSNYLEVKNLQMTYNLAVDQAVEAALYDVVEYDGQDKIIANEEEIVCSFFQALYMNLGIKEKPMEQELCKFYIPYILLVEMDGLVPFRKGEARNGEIISFQPQEKKLFELKGQNSDTLYVNLTDWVVYRDGLEGRVEGYYLDVCGDLPYYFQWDYEEFCERKRDCIIELIKKLTNECINQQNEIASRYGVHYVFTLPKIKYEDWYRTVQDISMLVLFQGYPFGNGVTGRYNRFAFGGARIRKAES